MYHETTETWVPYMSKNNTRSQSLKVENGKLDFVNEN